MKITKIKKYNYPFPSQQKISPMSSGTLSWTCLLLGCRFEKVIKTLYKEWENIMTFK